MAENTTETTEVSAPIEAAEPTATAVEAPAPVEREQRYDRNDRGDRDDRRSGPPMRSVADLLPDLQGSSEDEERKEVAGGRAYEITYIVVANNPEALETTQKRVRELIEGAEGAIDNVRVSETRRLAYPINKRTEGVYIVANARFAPSLIAELERFFKIDETVLRHVVLRESE